MNAINQKAFANENSDTPHMSVRELIEKHQSAFCDNEAALRKRDLAETRYRKSRPPLILAEIAKGWHQELPHKCSPEEAKQSVRREIDRYYQKRLDELERQNLSSAVQEAAHLEILRQKRAAYRNLIEATAKLAEEQERFGLITAERAVKTAEAALMEIELTLLACPNESLEDLQLKAEYMLSATSGPGALLYSTLGEEQHLRTFLSSLARTPAHHKLSAGGAQ